MTQPGLVGFRIAGSERGGVEWRVLDDTWSVAGELGVFDAGWMADHLTNAGQARGGGSLETFTTLAALSMRAVGMWLGVVVAANTFRHPALLAKECTVLDNVTGGQFVLGLGAGWHEGEHDQFGIPLPPMRERFDRYESALRVLRALFSDDARQAPGVTLDDPFYPLKGATNEPPPLRTAGPPIWLGGQRRRGIALAARYGDGWVLPGNRLGDVAYFREKRDEILRALEEAHRDPAEFTFAAQVRCGERLAELREAFDTAAEFVREGAAHVILTMPADLGVDGVRAMAAEVAAPLRELSAA